MNTAARAKILVTDNDVKQKALAAAIGISESKMSGYLNGHHEMPTRVLAGIADYFHVTTDYLLGRTDDPNPSISLSPEEEAFILNFRSLSRNQRELIMQNIRLMREQNQR